ncbi:MAG: hypothetical protein GXP37_06130 [Chloroflexi bacterium]|nr:hypothetical protein [Chloroflexota bacterium]
MNHSLSRKLFLILSLALLLTLSGTSVWAQGNGPATSQQTGPPVVSYQGRVTVNGQPFDGTGYFMFAIVDSQAQLTWTSDVIVQAQSPQQLSPPTQPISIPVSQGLFNVLLGNPLSMNPLPPQAFLDPPSLLRVWFSSDGLSFTQLPDRPLASVPYAMIADTLDGYDSSDFAGIDHNHWSESWNGSGTGLELQSSDGVGVFGISGAKSGNMVLGGGVWGDSAKEMGVLGTSNLSPGVAGISSDSSGVVGMSTNGAGVRGTSLKNAGVEGSGSITGTVGIANNTSGPTRGIYGESASTSGAGVYGKATATSGQTAGVVGESDSTSGAGVSGYADAASGSNYGVYGTTTSEDGYGVYGTGPGTAISGFSKGTSGIVYGVRGRSASSDGAGVAGFNVASSGDAYGVFGRSDSNTGAGVYGLANAGGGESVGVHGKAASLSGKGVYGEGGYYGLYGVGTDPSGLSHGVYGETGSTANHSSGVKGVAVANSGITYGVYGKSNSADGFGVYSDGNMHVNGTLSWKVITHTLSLPPAAFLPGRSGIQYENTHYLRNMDGGICNSQKPFMAPVNLQDGAIIIALREFVYNRAAGPWTDADSSCATVEVRLIRVNLLDGSFDVMMSLQMSGSVPQGSYRNFLTKSVSPFAAAIVDNTHYSYFVAAFLPGTGVEINLVGATIDYQITQP